MKSHCYEKHNDHLLKFALELYTARTWLSYSYDCVSGISAILKSMVGYHVRYQISLGLQFQRFLTLYWTDIELQIDLGGGGGGGGRYLRQNRISLL